MVWFRVQLLLALLVVVPGPLAAQEIAPGDTVHIRLLDRLASGRHAPRNIRALVIAPVTSPGARVVVPPGSIVTGHVTGSGKENFGGKRHWLALQLDSLAIPIDDATTDTARASVAMRVALVDDAREIVDSAGRIVGPPIPSVVRSKREWVVLLLGVFHPVGALVLAATLEGEIAERHRAVSLTSGTELTMVITRGGTLGRWSQWAPPPQISSGVNSDSLASSAPLRTLLRAGGRPSDVISLAFVGSAAQVSAALAAAGWTRAHENIASWSVRKIALWSYAMYLAHNYSFLAYSAAMEGRKAETIAAVDHSRGAVTDEMLLEMPGMDWYVAESYAARVRFGLWEEMLALPAPNSKLIGLTAGYLYGRAVALAATRRIPESRATLGELQKLAAAVPADAGAGQNSLKSVLAIAIPIAAARIAEVEGRPKEALALLRQAVAAEDGIAYDEPKNWFFPARQVLGAALLRQGAASEAEHVYREDLRQGPANGWSLFGLSVALKMLGKTAEAEQAAQQFAESWKYSDVAITASSY